MKYFDFDRSLINSYSEEFEKIFNVPANKSPISIDKLKNFNDYADIACSAQSVLTEIIINYLSIFMTKPKLINFI